MIALGIVALLILSSIVGAYVSWQTNEHNKVLIKAMTQQSAKQAIIIAQAAKKSGIKKGTISINNLEKKGDLAKGFKNKSGYGRKWKVTAYKGRYLIWSIGYPKEQYHSNKIGTKYLSWKVANRIWKKNLDPQAIIGIIRPNSTTFVSYKNSFTINVSPFIKTKPYYRTAIYYGKL